MAGKKGMRIKSDFGTLVPADGKWKPSYVDPTGKRVYLPRTLTKAEGRQALNAVEAELRQGTWVDPTLSARTVEDVANLWLASNPSKRPNTVATDRSDLGHILPTLGAFPVGDVKRIHVERLVSSWQRGDKPAAPRTIARRYMTLKSVFQYAVLNRWLAVTPCVGVTLPKVDGTRRVQLTDTQVRDIANATRERYRPMVWLGALTGARWSEVAALRVGDVEIGALTVTIDETVIRDSDGNPLFSGTKTAAGRRTVPIPATLARQLEKLMAEDGTALDADALLWPSPTDPDAPLRPDVFRNRVWYPALKGAGLFDLKPHRPGFHDLRRAFSTALVLGGADAKTAQELMGHSDIRTTLAIYASSTVESRRDAAEAVAARFLPED